MSTENHAETIARLTVGQVYPVPITEVLDDGRIIQYVPKGKDNYEARDITESYRRPAPIPPYVTQNLTVQMAGSMIGYVNRFKNADTVIFASIVSNSFQAIIDYHKMPLANLPSDGTTDKAPASHEAVAQLKAHRANLQLQFSEQWGIWTGANEDDMRHVKFAKFLEENADDVISPPGNELLQIISDIKATQNMAVQSSVRQGAVEKFQFVNDKGVMTDKGVELPQFFTISIPVYFGGRAVPIKCFLRREVEDGVLTLSYSINRMETVRQNEFHEIAAAIDDGVNATGSDAANVPVLYGAAS